MQKFVVDKIFLFYETCEAHSALYVLLRMLYYQLKRQIQKTI